MPNCRVVKNKEPWHVFTALDRYGGEFILVGPGKRTYLAVHTNNAGPKGFGCIMGAATLRKMARAILRSVPPCRRKEK